MMIEKRRQESEDRSQKTGVRRQESETGVRSQESEDRSQKTGVRRQNPDRIRSAGAQSRYQYS